MGANLPLEVRIIILASALERSKEYEARCRRRLRNTKQEWIDADDEVRMAEAQLTALQAEWLKWAK